MPKVVLSIAGSDPSGGAGIQADLKTFHAHRCFGQAVISLLTVQDTRGVYDVSPVSPDWVLRQTQVVLRDTVPAAVKIGAIAHGATLRALATELAAQGCPWVVDPLLRSTSGAAFGDHDILAAMCEAVLPAATLLTPNLAEAEALTGRSVTTAEQARAAAERLLELGASAALVTGGHLPGAPVDWLALPSGTHAIEGERIDTRHTHGTGCAYSSAITCRLGHGEDLLTAVRGARSWLTEALRNPPGLGHGHGPIDFFAAADGCLT